MPRHFASGGRYDDALSLASQSRGSRIMFDRRTQLAAARTAVSLAILSLAILATLFGAEPAAADVTTVGVVAPIPPVNGGTSSGQLIVGNGTDEDSNDLWGWVDIDGGTLLQYGSVILGDNEGFFGQVNISGNFLGGQITQFNLTGIGATSNPIVQVGNEGTGYLNIDGGARMTLSNSSADFAIGLDSTGVGTVTASDQFTMITSGETIVVGQSGVGTLNVLNGAMVRTLANSRSNYITIGRDIGSIGSAVVDGAGSLLRTGSTLRVGEAGIGSLVVRNGATVLAIDATTPVAPIPPIVGIGLSPTGAGHVVIEGTGSRLQTTRDMVIGGTDSTGLGTGLGTLTIRDGGLVQVTTKNVSSVNVGPFGRLELHNGTFDGSTPVAAPMPTVPSEYGTIVNGYVGGSGLIRGSVYIGGFASAGANSGDTLRFDGPVLNQGSININGGEIQFFGSFRNNALLAGPTPPAAVAGRISIENGGTLRLPAALTTINNGVISNAHGTTNIYGRITNNGEIVVARDTVATFFDTVNNTGTITVLPGGNALFLGDLVFTSAGAGAGDFDADLGGGAAGSGGASLVLGIDPENPGGASSHVDVSGMANLSGTLVLSLEGGFSSLVGQTLILITAGNVVGAFDSILLPPVPNDLEVGLIYTSTGLSMQISSIPDGIPGDYNDDGIVNAADYTVWRDHLGSATALPNDNTPGVAADDYTRWKTNFGNTAGAGGFAGQSSNAVPEPSILQFAVLGLAALVCRARSARLPN
jgi:T5SS/PEP-CTERM-associated repeat protein